MMEFIVMIALFNNYYFVSKIRTIATSDAVLIQKPEALKTEV